MADGSALVEGITHLAEMYCDGNTDGVQVQFDDNNDWALSVSLVEEKTITAETSAFMAERGYVFRPAAGEGMEPNPYHSYFSLLV